MSGQFRLAAQLYAARLSAHASLSEWKPAPLLPIAARTLSRSRVDTAVMSIVRRQRRPPQLHALQFPADAGDAGPDQRLVADEPAGETHQDRREGLSHGRYVAFHWA
jgi:hypothetical protein